MTSALISQTSSIPARRSRPLLQALISPHTARLGSFALQWSESSSSSARLSRHSRARRNQFTHEYPTVDDALVWAIVEKDVPLLRWKCSVLLKEAGSQEERE